jgi:hypothetical protein
VDLWSQSNYLCFLWYISVLIRMMAIVNPIKVKAIVIRIRGLSILGSIEGEESLLMLAGWCRVFHQSTENLIIGRLMDPTITKTAVIFSATLILVKEFFKKIIIKYKNNNIATDVSLASHTHQVPHIGFPQKDPVIRHIKVKVAPIGATADVIIKPKGILKARPIILYNVMIEKVNSASQADGT